jgi:hypothetical protein
MSAACERRFPKLVDRAFVRGLPVRQRAQLRAHIATCEACRARWERLAAIERGMGGPRLGEAVLDDIARTVVGTSRGRRGWWAASALGAVAAAAIVLLVMRDPSSKEFSPRGDPSMGRTPGVRLFCVAGDADHVRSEARMVSSGHVPKLRCTIDDDLQFAYTTADREGLTMVAFARLDSMTIHYAPTTSAGDTTPLHTQRVDELLDWSTPLAADHKPGTYDVVVRLFDRSVAARDAIEGRVPAFAELRAKLDIVARGGSDDAR